ncbi:MAG: hypothetical protein V3U87_11465 [Methylococcaceae bacterium]
MLDLLTNEEKSNTKTCLKFISHIDDSKLSFFDYRGLNDANRYLFTFSQIRSYGLVKKRCVLINKQRKYNKIAIGYINNPDFQAYAEYQDNYYFIEISACIPAIIQSLFSILAIRGNPFLLSEDVLGRTPIFSNRSILFPLNIHDITAKYSDASQSIKHFFEFQPIPPKKQQFQFSSALSSLAIIYCINHELGHVMCGHTLRLFEVRNTQLSVIGGTIKKEIRQAWELEADRSAFLSMIDFSFNNRYVADWLRKSFQLNSTDTLLHLIRYIVFSVCFVLFLFGQYDFDIVSRSHHPSITVRVCNMILSIRQLCCVPKFGFTEEQVTKEVQLGFEIAQKTWQRFGLQQGIEETETSWEQGFEELSKLYIIMENDRTEYKRYNWAYSNL